MAANISHCPDLVILDLGLPDMDGVDVIRKVRSWSNMPIIVISARSEDHDKIEALDAGADDYLTKPFSIEELLARLRVTQRRIAYMASGAQKTDPVFVNGKLRIDYIASLRVFMATLRKKLEPTPDSPQYIQTHIGIGYRMLKVE